MQSLPDPPKLAYSIAQAVKATSLSKTTIYARIADGTLRAVRIGGRTIIPADALQSLLAGKA